MTRSSEEQRAYQRGYQTGSRHRWPSGTLISEIPDEKINAMVRAALDARAAITDHFATLDEDARTEDRLAIALSAAEDALSEALEQFAFEVAEHARERKVGP